MATTEKQRALEFETAVKKDRIDARQLSSLCFGGIPETPGLRSICWKILLGYLPARRSDWDSVLQQKRNVYVEYLRDLIVNPHAGSRASLSSLVDITEDDHPLNPHPTSKWNEFFKDNEVLDQIDKDVRRTLPDMAFFQMAVAKPPILTEAAEDGFVAESLKQRVERRCLGPKGLKTEVDDGVDYDRPLGHGLECRWEVIERILFVWAKLNPGISYVQGMNEILGPLYFTMANDPSPDWKDHAEADAFYCFNALMSEVHDMFIKTLDDSEVGVRRKMVYLMDCLAAVDEPLAKNMAKKNVNPQFFAFRWLTLLLSQEFQLPDVIRIWDSMFAFEGGRINFLLCFCVAMLVLVRDELLAGDFGENLKMLQNYPLGDVQVIVSKSNEIKAALTAKRLISAM